MKKIVILFCSLAVSVIVCLAQTSVGRSSTQSHVTNAFAKVVPVLRHKTSVPLRFPTDIPGLGEDKFYAILTSADEDGYEVELGATPDCEGQHVCSFGTVIGTKLPLNEVDEITGRRKTPVNLKSGIKGHFYQSVCGAYCSDSLISWTEGKYHYVIGLKAESMANLEAAANSAIQAGSARWEK